MNKRKFALTGTHSLPRDELDEVQRIQTQQVQGREQTPARLLQSHSSPDLHSRDFGLGNRFRFKTILRRHKFAKDSQRYDRAAG